MKQGSRKLALQRETLVALTPDSLDAVAGGQSVMTTLPQTRGLSVCPSQISVCPSKRVCPTQSEVSFSNPSNAGGGK